MNGPSDEFRAAIYEQLSAIPNVSAEGEREVTPAVEIELSGVLGLILGTVRQQVEGSEVLNRVRAQADQTDGGAVTVSEIEAQDLLLAIDEWASVASYAVEWVYAPASPSPKKMAGWGRKSIEYLRQITGVLLAPLNLVADAFQADSYSLNVGFPWGISVGLDWPSAGANAEILRLRSILIRHGLQA
jgi:Asp-tRNA(Asn)/Glu-tRNA(Gln) amidotransferase A subunit family amidase